MVTEFHVAPSLGYSLYRIVCGHGEVEIVTAARRVGTPPLSDDDTLQLTTDGASFAFSIEDTTGACHGAVYSDQDGVICSGGPFP